MYITKLSNPSQQFFIQNTKLSLIDAKWLPVIIIMHKYSIYGVMLSSHKVDLGFYKALERFSMVQAVATTRRFEFDV